MGRLFDAVAALLGFTREITFEDQAAMWLEYLAQEASATEKYPFPLRGDELDFRPLLQAVIDDRRRGRRPEEIARAFHNSVGQAVLDAMIMLCEANRIDTVVLSDGVFQNRLLLQRLPCAPVTVWTNIAVSTMMAASAWDRLQSGVSMHELSIAMSILELPQEESERRGGAAVEAIHLQIGRLSGVVTTALESVYELAREQTPFERCRLVIEDVPVAVFCANCRAERPVRSVQWFCCADCNTPASEVMRGRELQVTALELAS